MTNRPHLRLIVTPPPPRPLSPETVRRRQRQEDAAVLAALQRSENNRLRRLLAEAQAEIARLRQRIGAGGRVMTADVPPAVICDNCSAPRPEREEHDRPNA